MSEEVNSKKLQITAIYVELLSKESEASLIEPNRTVLNIIRSNGGDVIQNASMQYREAYFGVFDSRESHSVVACKVALEIVNYFKLSSGPVDVIVSINTDQDVVVFHKKNKEEQEGGRVSFTGNVIKSCFELSRKIPRNSIGISTQTYNLVINHFICEQHDDNESRETYFLLLGRKPPKIDTISRKVLGIETHMYGRKRELDNMSAALSAMQENKRMQIVTICGEAGVGKSRLHFEFNKLLENSSLSNQIMRVDIHAYEDLYAQPYSLIRQLVLSLLNKKPFSNFETFEELVDVISNLLGTEMVNASSYFGLLLGLDISTPEQTVIFSSTEFNNKLASHLIKLFRIASMKMPIVLFVEDAHWMDYESLLMMKEIVKNLYQYPIMLIILGRNNLPKRWRQLEINSNVWDENRATYSYLTLSTLTIYESQQLIEEIIYKIHKLPNELVKFIVQTTEGNPYFIEEYIKYLVDLNLVKEDVTAGFLLKSEVQLDTLSGVPPALINLLQLRFTSQPEEVQHILQMASIIGRFFWDKTLSHLVNFTKFENLINEEMNDEQMDKRALKDILMTFFSHDDLRELVFDLNLPEGNLVMNMTRRQLVMGIVDFCHRQDIQSSLIDYIFRQRPALESNLLMDNRNKLLSTYLNKALSVLESQEIIFKRANSRFETAYEYVFKHELLRQVIYQTIPKSDRSKMHKLVGDWVSTFEDGIYGEPYNNMILQHYKAAE